jgi:hemerythrin superfamily protein
VASDAIVLLRDDHKHIRRLFREFQAAGDKAVKKKARLAGQIIELLTVHTYIENEVMYPEVRALLPDLEQDILESFEEHHVADVLCAELSAMPANGERFTAKATVLIENVTHHMEEEEQDWFPRVRAGLGRKQLRDIGTKLQEARKKAPRSPAQPSALKKTIDAVIS